MLRFFTTLLILLLGTAQAFAQGAQKYAGEWKIIKSNLQVTLKSWGQNCGPKPQSYANNKIREVIIIARGDHLVFSRGGVRTDRCWSPNPRIRSTAKSIGGGKWKRTCKTPPDDPRFEEGNYTLSAKGTDRLDYLAVSKVDWRLKGDHCVALLREKRVYLRANVKLDDRLKPPRDEDKPRDATEPRPEQCKSPGPLNRLSLQPRRVRIGPGDRICFRAMGHDAQGCRFPVEAVFRLTQEGRDVQGLLSPTGCFSAGDTAADSEGVYVIAARAEGKRALAEVQVVFPDLSELLSAQLRASEELMTSPADAGSPPTKPATGKMPTAEKSARETESAAPPSPAPAVKTAPSEGETGSSGVLLWGIIVGLVLVGGIVATIVVMRRRAAQQLDVDDDRAWFGDAEGDDDDVERGVEVTCPTCHRSFPSGALFCPFHGVALVPAKQDQHSLDTNSKSEISGMICPKCHRGYKSDARFCPHDSQGLVPYEEWRKKNVSVVTK